jgi:hypothetical protein
MAAVCDGMAAPSSKVTWSLWRPKCETMPRRHLGKVGLGEPRAAAKTSDPGGGTNCETQLGWFWLSSEHWGKAEEAQRWNLFCFSANSCPIYRRYTDHRRQRNEECDTHLDRSPSRDSPWETGTSYCRISECAMTPQVLSALKSNSPWSVPPPNPAEIATLRMAPPTSQRPSVAEQSPVSL